MVRFSNKFETRTEIGNSMDYPITFYKSVIDSVAENIVVIDQHGKILFVNRSWTEFGQKNGCPVSVCWLDGDYLENCVRSATAGDPYGFEAAEGIRKVISHQTEHFYLEYPCHSPTEKRWFTMRVNPLGLINEQMFVISHQNITERKLAEDEIMNLSRIDGLTGLANRRFFDEFLDSELRRCERMGLPIGLILLDIDHFKLYNDTYGHLAGDDCLRKVGEILRMLGKRPGDIAARYGGDEFIIALGSTSLIETVHLAQELLEALRYQSIPFQSSPISDRVTVSMGVSAMAPEKGTHVTKLIGKADTLLYSAKEKGRNRIEVCKT